MAASTQNQAMNALVLLYRKVLDWPLVERIDALRATRLRQFRVWISKKLVPTVSVGIHRGKAPASREAGASHTM